MTMTNRARPRVFINMASSLDGKTNPTKALRADVPFTMSRHDEDSKRMLRIRATAGAIVIGAGNLKADDPNLAVAPAERARRSSLGTHEPLRVIVTSHAKGLHAGYAAFDPTRGGETVVAHAAGISDETRALLAPHATLVELGDESVDIARLLDWLLRERDVGTVLCEGGGILNAAFFAARAVDSMYLTLVPRVLGGGTAATVVAGSGFAVASYQGQIVANLQTIPDATLGDVDRAGDELFLRYDFAWPEA